MSNFERRGSLQMQEMQTRSVPQLQHFVPHGRNGTDSLCPQEDNRVCTAFWEWPGKVHFVLHRACAVDGTSIAWSNGRTASVSQMHIKAGLLQLEGGPVFLWPLGDASLPDPQKSSG